MIVVDSSSVVAIALGEPDADAHVRLIVEQGAIIGTPTLAESSMVLTRRIPTFVDAFVERLLGRMSVRPDPFTLEMFREARHAFSRYGKGQGHPAQLNFGDCLSYAVAKVHGLPLLFKGEDFIHTDIAPALRP